MSPILIGENKQGRSLREGCPRQREQWGRRLRGSSVLSWSRKQGGLSGGRSGDIGRRQEGMRQRGLGLTL